MNVFVRAVYRRHPVHRRRSQHILRALVLIASEDFALQDLGTAFLFLNLEDLDEAKTWGIQVRRLGYQEVVENISRILAIEQCRSARNRPARHPHRDRSPRQCKPEHRRQYRPRINDAARNIQPHNINRVVPVGGLENPRRQCSSCGRRPVSPSCRRCSGRHPPGFGRCLLTKRFTRFYEVSAFTPPYPTWPVSDAALDESVDYTPRALMQAADRHIGMCLRSGTLTEMTSLRQEEVTEPEPLHDDPGLTALDRRFDELIAVAIRRPCWIRPRRTPAFQNC